MTNITRVWGICDNLKIEFGYEGGAAWSCTVPPDLKDGIYVAEFWAQDDRGRVGHWSGFLYMNSGICHFKLKKEKYQVWFCPSKYKIEIEKNDFYNFKNEKTNRLLKIRQIQEKSNCLSARLNEAILDIMLLDYDLAENDTNKKKKYQIRFKKEKHLVEILKSNYKIFIKKRCKHW